MVSIELNEAEREALLATLRNVVSDLGMEIAATDRLSFREELKDRRDHLRQIEVRLAGMATPS